MTAREGTCSGCNSRFRIPESFAGDRAKCRKCGGVIEITPPVAAREPDPEPESAPESSTTEATAFTFSSLSARAMTTAKAAAMEVEPEREPVEPMAVVPPPARPKPKPKAAPHHAATHAATHAEPPAEPRRSKRGLWIGCTIAALLVIAGGGGGWMLWNAGDSHEPAGPAQSPAAATDHSASLATPASRPEAAADAPAKAADAEPAADPAPTDDGEPPAPPPDPPSTKFEFVAIERSPGTNDEEWDRMQELSATLRDGGKARKLALKELLYYGIKAVPVLINSLNGLDLSKYSQWVDGAEVSRFIQDDLLAETILIPYHGAFSTDAKEIRHNQVVLKSMVDYWNAQVNDPARWGALLQKYEEKKATRGNRGGDGD